MTTSPSNVTPGPDALYLERIGKQLKALVYSWSTGLAYSTALRKVRSAHVDCAGTWGRVAWELQSEQIRAVTDRYTKRPRRVAVQDAIDDLGSDPPLVLIGPWSNLRREVPIRDLKDLLNVLLVKEERDAILESARKRVAVQDARGGPHPGRQEPTR